MPVPWILEGSKYQSWQKREILSVLLASNFYRIYKYIILRILRFYFYFSYENRLCESPLLYLVFVGRYEIPQVNQQHDTLTHCNFADKFIIWISLNETFSISGKISSKYIPLGITDNISALDQIMAPNRRQAIIWDNSGLVHWRRIFVPLGLNTF